MEDQTILTRIRDLIQSEKELRENPDHGPQDAARLRELEESLDQCWDLLRRRRAQREFGESADAAHSRPVPEVENYLQ